MSKDTIRVVIRQPLHPLLREWSKLLGIDDFGEIVNYLLLDLKRSGHLPNSQAISVVSIKPQEINPTNNSIHEVNELAGLF
jgi:hypothetical protein